ncbi:hypothetical protein K08M3_25400 [Vibrio alginolyticus]|uniref:DUF2541 domain-containing protein n=3 Tax=Vibrio harveyi group TaxID=717610 RepID=A0A1W6TEQ3_VIBAL|nr:MULTISPECIES: hypothetical protein [Vibrio]MDW1808168.1 hypothetical protein [Vibrio sp. Vb2362]MDW2295028.1 hypothetical protein [Vibrio sp. 1404]NAW54089.1 hypothetical protein [Vibrio sp. V41_P2S12T139]NAW95886.1 hypothetical protein [Vibrio sp. V42_P2S4T144]ANP65607.1 hypothetical protein BAU10_11595 [Vibrio alginolyticus]
MKFLNTLLLCTLVAATSVSVFANNSDEWELIATKTVNFHTETDTVTPNSLFRNRSFSKIKLKCVQGTVDMNGLKVVMTDGSEKKLSSMGVLTSGLSTRAWSLPGTKEAKLKRIEMTYSSWGSTKLSLLGVSKKAKIEVWGKKKSNQSS